MLVLAPKMVASAASPSELKVPEVAVAVAVAVALPASAAGLAVRLVGGRAAACSAAVSSAGPAGLVAAVGLVAAAAVLEGAEVASDSPKTCGYRCWRRGSCRHGPRPSLAPRLLASARLRELAAPLLPRTDPPAAFSAEKEDGSGAMGSGPDCCLELETEVTRDPVWPRKSQASESPKELCE